MRVGVVHDAIFDIGHVLNLRFFPISIPTGVERKSLAAIVFVSASIATSAGAGDAAHERAAEARALNDQLMANNSATAVLGAWCASHHLAADPTIHAERDPVLKSPDRETLGLLGDPDPAVVHYRRVRLTCGTRVLSQAANWYRTDRLTPAMNAALETTRTPFGVVVAPLGFHRQNLSTTFLPERSGSILRHRAVLSTADGQPFSVVIETYTDEVLGEPTLNPSPR